jgi:hypothetical protein
MPVEYEFCKKCGASEIKPHYNSEGKKVKHDCSTRGLRSERKGIDLKED